MANENIFDRDISGEPISTKDPDFIKIREVQEKSWKLLAVFNSTYHDEKETLDFLQKLIGRQIPKSVRALAPFHTDFGRNIILGENVFINTNCTFMDRGGITIGDNVLIAPNVSITTINHGLNTDQRSTTICKPVIIEENVWIGIGATILPGIKIGKGAIVGAGSVVTKNVEAYSVVVGNPAKVVKEGLE